MEDDDDDANENKSLLEAHASFFQSACEKKRRTTEKNRIEFASFDASANVLVLKIHRRVVAAGVVVSSEGNEAKSEEEGELTLMFPVSFNRVVVSCDFPLALSFLWDVFFSLFHRVLALAPRFY